MSDEIFDAETGEPIGSNVIPFPRRKPRPIGPLDTLDEKTAREVERLKISGPADGFDAIDKVAAHELAELDRRFADELDDI